MNYERVFLDMVCAAQDRENALCSDPQDRGLAWAWNRIRELEEDGCSWRRVSERIESENIDLRARVLELEKWGREFVHYNGKPLAAKPEHFEMLNRTPAQSLIRRDASLLEDLAKGLYQSTDGEVMDNHEVRRLLLEKATELRQKEEI